MRIRNRGIVLAMEEGEVVEPVTDEVVAPVVEPVPEVPAEVEVAAAEVVEDEAEIDELNTAIEEAIEDTETLTDFTEIMDESVEKNEGLDPVAAEITEVAVESICNRLGMKYQSAVPALESFGSANSRVTATRIASENIKEKIVAAWEAIKKAFASMWAKIVEFLKKVFTQTGRLKETAKKLKEQAAALGDKKAAETHFKNDAAIQAFATGNSFTAAAVSTVLDNQLAVVTKCTEVAAGADATLKELEGVLDQVIAAKKVEAGVVGGVVRNFIKRVSDDTQTFKKSVNDNMFVYTSPVLVGGTKLSIAVLSGSEETGSYIRVIESGSKEVSASGSAGVPVLSGKDAEALCDKVTGLVVAVEQMEKILPALTNVEKHFGKMIDKAISKVGKLEGSKEVADEADVKAGMAKMKRGVSELGNSIGKLATRVPGLSLTASKAALSYVAGSLAQYKAPAKAEEKK